MSRETVFALHSLTNKMLKASSLAPPQKPGLPPIAPPSMAKGSEPPAAPAAVKTPPKMVPNVTTPPKPRTASSPVEPPIELVPPTGRGTSPAAVAEAPPPAAPEKEPGMLDSAMGYLGGLDWPTIVKYLGGMGAGGLAGYALGNMFQDEDDDSTPWLSTLAGGGLGLALPYLLSAYSGQPGVTQLGSAPGTDMPLFSPGSEIAPAQNVRPRDTSGLA